MIVRIADRLRGNAAKRAAAAGIALLILLGIWSRIGEDRITDDSAQILLMGVNLAHHGVISLEAKAPYTPTMYREPIPAIATALMVELVDSRLGSALPEAYTQGPRARFVKYQNLLWVLMLAGGGFLAAWALCGSFYTALVAGAAVVAPVPLLSAGPGALALDSVSTDLAAAALLTLAGGMMVCAARRKSVRWAVAAGLTFGLLAMTKASFYYVFLVYAVILLGAGAFQLARSGERRNFMLAVVTSVAFAIAVAPWIVRNGLQLGNFSVSERGGVVLYTRAIKNSMSYDEATAAIYYWAPRDLKPVLGRIMGLSPADARAGGRLQRLNKVKSAFGGADLQAELDGRPDDAVTYYRRARAERTRLVAELARRGVDDPQREADRLLRDKALDLIAARPLAHAAMTPLFLWRGAFGISIILAYAAVYAWLRRRADFAVIILPSAGLVSFFALLSHFIPRYGVAMTPTAIVLAVVIASNHWLAYSSGKKKPAVL